jgi:hypothetical protein
VLKIILISASIGIMKLKCTPTYTYYLFKSGDVLYSTSRSAIFHKYKSDTTGYTEERHIQALCFQHQVDQVFNCINSLANKMSPN